jgi:putative nucleotidyltransferase with HDIG domain
METITLKGDFQGVLTKTPPVSTSFLSWFIGAKGTLSRRDWYLLGYTGLLAALLAVFVGMLIGRADTGLVPLWPIAALAVSAIVAERQSVRLSPRAEISVSALPIVLAAVIYGPFAAVCVSVASLIPSLQFPYARWLIWTSTRSLAAGTAGVVALNLDNSSHHVFGRVLVAVAAATVVEQVGDLLLGSIAGLLRRISLRHIIQVASTMLLAMPLYVPVAALLVYAYREISPWSVALFLFPALVAQKLFLLYNEQRATAEELARALARQERAHLQFASTLVAALDADDQYTAGHSTAVAIYARDIAGRLGLSEQQQRLAHLAGLVHDIGKIGLPDGLLEKPGPLDSLERLEMEQHVVIGEHILANVEDYAEVASIVRHHHERVDGRGYPDGLIRDEIPLISRIVAVADAYNAMTSQRPYRDAVPPSEARIRLASGVDHQFDTAVVAAFEAVLANATDQYRFGKGPDFMLEEQGPLESVRGSTLGVLEAVAS